MTVAATLERIGPADADAMRRAEARHLTLTKPPGSLGRIEEVSVRLAGIFGTERPVIRGSAVIVAAGDHGVVAQGVTGPQAVTAQMVRNFLAGGAAVSVMSRMLGVRQIVVDAGIASDELPDHPDLRSVRAGRGTADISRGPAMSREQAERCLQAGRRRGGRRGRGPDRHRRASATPPRPAPSPRRNRKHSTGTGTGRTVVRRALERNAPDPADPLGVLAKVGGFEIGVLAGVMLGAACRRRAVVLWIMRGPLQPQVELLWYKRLFKRCQLYGATDQQLTTH